MKTGVVSKVGRPEISEGQKEEIVSKLEPYLKSGLRITKALREAGIPRSNFYKLMDRDLVFRDKIDRFRQFLSIMLNNAMVGQLQDIIIKQKSEEDLTSDDINFLKWFALNSNATKGEFGERKEVGLYDPEAEIQRIARLIDGTA